ncbi:MAG TPA: hypothetical protein VFH27_18185 [Longimicrobiaceae bacterium]|nr:hypothetical protein [Longimicrobiaceae bacterium]
MSSREPPRRRRSAEEQEAPSSLPGDDPTQDWGYEPTPAPALPDPASPPETPAGGEEDAPSPDAAPGAATSHEMVVESLRLRVQTVLDEARAGKAAGHDEPAFVLRMETIDLADTARVLLQRLPGGFGHIVLGSLPGDDPTGDWGTLVDVAAKAARQGNWRVAHGQMARIVQDLTRLPGL